METDMKIAVSGKGGVGKTTVSAMLAAAMSMNGQSVIALDADPDANLAAALGVPPASGPTALSEMRDLIAERTGSADAYGGYFKLNPKVDDIPDKYALRIDNIRLLVLGGVKKGGAGCICPASALLKALLTHIVLGRDEEVIMDMEAGIEHLGRATAQSMDALIIVVDKSPWSIQTALRIRELAADLGMSKLLAVANRVKDPADVAKIRRDLNAIPLIGQIPYDQRLDSNIVRITEGGSLEPGEGFSENLVAVKGIISELQALP